jgi:hypothetical protein
MTTLMVAVIAAAAAVGSTIFTGISLRMLASQTRSFSDQVRLQANQTKSLMKQTELQAEQYKILAKQTEENNRLTKANVSLNISTMMHRLSTVLLDNPELRTYIYDDCPLPSREPLRSQVLLMAEMFLDLMTMTIDHKPVFSPSDYRCWCRYFRCLLKKSPSLCYWYTETRDWYEPHVRELLDSFVARDVTARASETVSHRG